MATAAAIGSGLALGGIFSGIGSAIQAGKQADAAQANLEAAQAFQATQDQRAQQQFDVASQAQAAQLGLLGQAGGDEQAAQNLLSSPLVQAINQQNQQSVNAQAAASGVSGGNLLSALQDRNTATILNAGFQGLGGISNQGFGVSQGFTGAGAGALQLGMGAQTALGNAEGAKAAIPFLTGANIINQGTQLAGFGLGGGFGAGAQTAMQNFGNPFAQAPQAPSFGAPTVGGGGTLQGPASTLAF